MPEMTGNPPHLECCFFHIMQCSADSNVKFLFCEHVIGAQQSLRVLATVPAFFLGAA